MNGRHYLILDLMPGMSGSLSNVTEAPQKFRKLLGNCSFLKMIDHLKQDSII
jgi:hypothetical protein